MPAMIVWPLSSSELTRNDGSSARQPAQRHAHLVVIGLGLRLDGILDNGLRKLHAFQDDRLGRGAQRIAGGDFLEAGKGDDIAGARLFDVFAAVGVHQQHAAGTLLLALHCVEQGIAVLTMPE